MTKRLIKQNASLFVRIPRILITYEGSTDYEKRSFSNAIFNKPSSYMYGSEDLGNAIDMKANGNDNNIAKNFSDKKKNIFSNNSNINVQKKDEKENQLERKIYFKRTDFSNYLFKRYNMKKKILKELININREKITSDSVDKTFKTPFKTFLNCNTRKSTKYASFLRSFENKNRRYYYYKKKISNCSNYLSTIKLYYTMNNKNLHKNWKKPLKISLPHINLLPNNDISLKPNEMNEINKSCTLTKQKTDQPKFPNRNNKKILSVVKYEFHNINRY